MPNFLNSHSNLTLISQFSIPLWHTYTAFTLGFFFLYTYAHVIYLGNHAPIELTENPNEYCCPDCQ